MKESLPLVVIIVTNFNGKSIVYKSKSVLWHCFSSIKRTHYGNYKCVFTDDSSTDESVAYVKKNFPWADVIINKPNGGYAVDANHGAKYALKNYNPDYILFLNNDVIIKDRDWLSKLVTLAESDKQIGIVGCKYFYPNGNVQHAGADLKFGILPRSKGWNVPDESKYDKIYDVDLIGGGMFLLRRSLIDKVGLLDENFRHGNDDIEYSIRSKKAGFRNVYDGKVSLVHLEGFSAKTVTKSKKNKDFWFPIFQYQYMYLAFKHFGPIQVVGALAVTLLGSVIALGNRDVKVASFKLKDRKLWRISVTIKAISIAYKLNKHKITKEAAFKALASE